MAKRSKEERHEEFIGLSERVLGFPMVPWQKDRIRLALEHFAAGRPINICVCPPPPGQMTPVRHRANCPRGQ